MPFGLSAFAVKAIGIGLLVLAIIGVIAGFGAHYEEVGAAKTKADTAEAALKLSQEAQAKTAKIAADQQGIAHDAQLQAESARADAVRAGVARDAFRLQLNAYVSASRGPRNPPAATGSAPVDGGDPIGVLADVLGRSDARADIVEGLADQRRIRASACERSYNALSTATP